MIEEGHKTNKKRKYVGQQGAKGGDSKRKAAQANITEVEKLSDNVYNISFYVVVSKVNLVGNTKEWWVDTGASRHICSDKKMFSLYEAINDGEQLFMGNFSTSKIEGKGKVILKMTSGKELILNDVLCVLEI